MRVLRLVALSAFFTFFMSSCASLFQSHARVVSKKPGVGGVITVQQGFDGGANARLEADAMMRQNCNGSFDITEESEVVVGQRGVQDTESRKEKDYFYGQRKSTRTTTESRDVTEWRISYKCRK